MVVMRKESISGSSDGECCYACCCMFIVRVLFHMGRRGGTAVLLLARCLARVCVDVACRVVLCRSNVFRRMSGR